MTNDEQMILAALERLGPGAHSIHAIADEMAVDLGGAPNAMTVSRWMERLMHSGHVVREGNWRRALWKQPAA